MNKILFFILLAISSVQAQIPGQWVWIHGDSTSGSMGNYGKWGIPSPTNDPPAVYEPCQWTDNKGNFWLYGGFDNTGFHASLWKWDTLIKEWTWIFSSPMVNYVGNYGSQGVPSSSNQPPSKSYGVTTWTDTSGNLWMFAGRSANGPPTSDLWKYDKSNAVWTWMKGPSASNQPGVYGIKGVPSPANYPEYRFECAAGWTDSLNNLWLFGGDGQGDYNDLWKYHIATNEWAWMKGSNTSGQPGIYGSLGVEDSLNTPGSRGPYAHWKDIYGNFWLFGGLGAPNDLWKYNPTTNNWTWMGGSKINGDTGTYGKRCTVNSNNIPGQRFENRAVWTDKNDNFWMFGGTRDGNVFNDLWMYCFKQKQWIWVSGDSIVNPKGNWGTKGVSSPANKPNGRMGSVSWSDNNGRLYLFGGTSTPFNTPYNDLWEFTIDTTCSVCLQSLPHSSFVCSDTTICAEGNNCVNFTDISTGSPTTWRWRFPGATPDTSSQQNPTHICYGAVGTYPVTLIVTNSSGTDSLTVSPMITVGGTPPPPVITKVGDTLYSSHGSGYQWFLNGAPIAGATDSFYVAHQDGVYSVRITDSNGCNALSGGVPVGVQEVGGGGGMAIYPNPARDHFTIYGLQFTVRATLDIYNVLGERVYSYPLQTGSPKSETVNCKQLPSGFYFVRVSDGEKQYVGKVVIDKN